jgi:hypothetical protein
MRFPALLFLVLPAAVDAGGVDHTPLACIPADRYARVAARSAGATAADLEFRTRADGPWYRTRMVREGDAWVAFLPRPAQTLGEIEYRITTTDASAKPESGASVRARVGAPGECDDAGRAAVDAPIVVQVPEGAPVVPPVPPGLSPAGVVAAEAPKRSNRALKIVGGVAAVAIIGATAAGTAETTGEPPTTGEAPLPAISFNNIDPPPGSSFNYNRTPFVVHMRLATRPEAVRTVFWRVELRAANGRSCVEMSGTSTLVPDSNEFFLTTPLVSSGACGFVFDVAAVYIAITHQNQLVFEQSLALPYHVEP